MLEFIMCNTGLCWIWDSGSQGTNVYNWNTQWPVTVWPLEKQLVSKMYFPLDSKFWCLQDSDTKWNYKQMIENMTKTFSSNTLTSYFFLYSSIKWVVAKSNWKSTVQVLFLNKAPFKKWYKKAEGHSYFIIYYLKCFFRKCIEVILHELCCIYYLTKQKYHIFLQAISPNKGG